MRGSAAAFFMERISRAPVKIRIIALVLVSLSFPFTLSVLLIRSNYDAVESFRRDVEIYATVNRIKTANRDHLRLLSDYLESGTMDSLNSYNEGVEAYVGALKALERGVEDLELSFLLHAIWNSFGSLYDESHLAIRRRIQESGDCFSAYYRAERISRYQDGYIAQVLDRTLSIGMEKYQTRVEIARTGRNVSIFFLLLAAVSSVGLGAFFADYLTRPLTRLAAAAKRMSENDLDIEVIPVESADEVGGLTSSFNRMSAHISALVRDLKEKAELEDKLHREELRNSTNEKMRKEAEFLALQARINPHFLFNTLNTISRDVMLRGGRDAIALIDALSSLLRYGLEQGSGVVSLQTELEIVRKYAFIQSYRFDERINISVDCQIAHPDEVMIPAFSIQPLVENSLIHGLEPKVDGGAIVVLVFRRGKSVVVQVLDDGIGMDASRLRAIRASRELESSGHTSSIGLSNVRDRLRLFTGNRMCFRIGNRREGGTMAEVVIQESRS